MAKHPLNTDSGAGSEKKEGQETMVRYLVYYAAERTLMAWIRSALGLKALGFVIDRFGLILRQTLPVQGTRFYPKLFSFWTGTAIVALGTLMAVTAKEEIELCRHPGFDFAQGWPLPIEDYSAVSRIDRCILA